MFTFYQHKNELASATVYTETMTTGSTIAEVKNVRKLIQFNKYETEQNAKIVHLSLKLPFIIIQSNKKSRQIYYRKR